MGLHLVDNVNLARLAPVCAEQERWEFLCVVAPLRIPGGTGCPVNPIAIF
jgi:kynurenine formamidase